MPQEIVADERLKKCPFCGFEACVVRIMNGDVPQTKVRCTVCKISTTAHKDERKVISNWNMRYVAHLKTT